MDYISGSCDLSKLSIIAFISRMSVKPLPVSVCLHLHRCLFRSKFVLLNTKSVGLHRSNSGMQSSFFVSSQSLSHKLLISYSCSNCFFANRVISPHIHSINDEVYSWESGHRGRLGRDTSEDVFQTQLVPFFSTSGSPTQYRQWTSPTCSVTVLVTRPDTSVS